MNSDDEVELHLTGKDAASPGGDVTCTVRGHITHCEGEWVTVQFPREDSRWEICAAKANFEQNSETKWTLSLK